MEDKCFLIKTRRIAEGFIDYCELTDRICELVYDKTCGTWERFKREERRELDKGVGG